jgi:uncharacterized membrane protein
MMAAHTARLVPFADRPAWGRAVLLYEPVIPSLFLFLVGFSLTLSRSAARARFGEADSASAGFTWYARQARRAVGLWAISVVFFVAEYGARLPDALLSGGILAVIAFSILLVGALLLVPGRAVGVALALPLIAGTVVFQRLDAQAHVIYPLTSGAAPLLPMMLFALAGAWVGGVRNARARWILGLAGAAVAVALIHRFGAEALFTKPFGRGDAGRTLAAPLFPAGDAVHVGFYDLRPVLALACLGLHLVLLVGLGAALRNIPENAARALFALGRHALGAYVLHLSILAAIVTAFGRQPLTAVTATATWIALILICQTGAFLLQAKKRV